MVSKGFILALLSLKGVLIDAAVEILYDLETPPSGPPAGFGLGTEIETDRVKYSKYVSVYLN